MILYWLISHLLDERKILHPSSPENATGEEVPLAAEWEVIAKYSKMGYNFWWTYENELSRETSSSYGVQDNWNLCHYVHEVMDHFGINCYHFSLRRQHKISWVPFRGKKLKIICINKLPLN